MRELEPVANDFINSIAYMQEPAGWYMLYETCESYFLVILENATHEIANLRRS